MRFCRTIGEGRNVLLLEPKGLLEPRSGTKARIDRTVGTVTLQNSLGDEGCACELPEGGCLLGSSPHFVVVVLTLSAGRFSCRMRGHLNFRVDGIRKIRRWVSDVDGEFGGLPTERWLGGLALQSAALTWKNSGVGLEDQSLSGEKIDKLQLVTPDEGASLLQREISGFSRACHKCLRAIAQLIIL